MGDKGNIILSAGGTGGHLFPAQALAHELRDRGWTIHLATDKRATRYSDNFPASSVHVIDSATPSGKNIFRLVGAAFSLMRGARQARALIKKLKPAAVVGFGGYPTIPPLISASGLVPTLIHEQNAVMGRANKLLSGRVTAIAGGFLKAEGKHSEKIVETGNPVRPAVLDHAGSTYSAPAAGENIKLVIFGGSQGAQFFARSVPMALAKLDTGLLSRLQVTQQARPEDVEAATQAYKAMGVTADVAPFFDDLPQRIADSHLVMARSGASTVSEIAAIGRPAVFVPYPHALDHDQAANAAALEAIGGALVKRQDTLDEQTLTELFTNLLTDGGRLEAMAQAALKAGKPDAASLLADLTEAIASGQSIAKN